MVRTLSESEMNNLKSYYPELEPDQKYVIGDSSDDLWFMNKAATEAICGLYGYGGDGDGDGYLDN